MKKWLAGLLFLYFVPAAAANPDAMVARDPAGVQGLTVTLLFSPCTLKGKISELPPEVRGELQRARVVEPGKVTDACWLARDAQGLVFLVDEAGRVGALPMDAFAPVTKI